MKTDKSRAALMLHGAVMLFGLSGVIGRGVDVPPHYIAWGRSLCSSAILFLIMGLRRADITMGSRKDYIAAVSGGAILAFHWTAFFMSVKTASVAIGTVTFSAFPIFTVLLEPLVFHERPRGRELALAAVMTFGVCLTVPELSLENSVTAGVVWGIASAASYAVLTLINRGLAEAHSSVKICFYEQGTAAAVLTPFVIASKDIWGTADIAGVAAIGVICTALAFSMFVRAQRDVTASAAAVISGMETVYGMVFAAFFLSEMPSQGALMGGAIILTAAALMTVTEKR